MGSPVRRVHVIGGPGAGKTWLAGKLGVALRYPVHELDTFPDIAAIAGQETWISEGVFLWAITPLLERAEPYAQPAGRRRALAGHRQ